MMKGNPPGVSARQVKWNDLFSTLRLLSVILRKCGGGGGDGEPGRMALHSKSSFFAKERKKDRILMAREWGAGGGHSVDKVNSMVDFLRWRAKSDEFCWLWAAWCQLAGLFPFFFATDWHSHLFGLV
jgi:hypothetical protein